MKRWLTDATPMRLAEVRLTIEFLGEGVAVDMYDRATVDVAMNTREGRSTAALHRELFRKGD